ncbi:MAG: hypothetical protein AAF236_03105 [Verrucomicrobiota bacterium]
MPVSKIYQSICTAFEEAGWQYAQVDGREVVRAGFEAHHTRVNLHVQAFAELSGVAVVAESDRRTDEAIRRERLSELAMRVNESLTIGNFEVRWDSGQLNYRLANLFPDDAGDISLIQGLVHNTVGEMDRIAPIEAMIHQSTLPELAGLDLGLLINRKDLLPEVPDIELPEKPTA